MFIPTVLGTNLFVIAGLGIGGWKSFLAILMLLFVTAIPFQYTYQTLFPEEPEALGSAKLSLSALMIVTQLIFWLSIFALAHFNLSK